MSWIEPWMELPCVERGCSKVIKVCWVDEDMIEEAGEPWHARMNRDFVEGDNWIHDRRQTDHPKYVPDHHIFISRLFKEHPEKALKTLAHEIFEVGFESMGLEYDEAHKITNEFETAVSKAMKGG